MRTDKFRIDSHKLIYHPERVVAWLKGENVYPIYMEISPIGACNHRCAYCGLDFMEYRPRCLDEKTLRKFLEEAGRLGIRSVMYAGEGEPFLHPRMSEVIEYTNECGIDAAVTTNGVLFTAEMAEKTLPFVKWIKISVDGATAKTYSKIHRCGEEDFDKALRNTENAVRIKRSKGYGCALGMQLLLLPENSGEVVQLASIARDIGVDYLVVKPYSQHPQSRTKIYSSVRYEEYLHLARELEKFNTEYFSVIFRVRTMEKWDDKRRSYKKCMALPFWAYVDAGGNVWGCSVFLGDKRFYYGNINERSFKDIWEGEKRLGSLKWAEEDLDASVCRVNCRMDEANRYLAELKDPPEHVNFI